MQNSGFILDSTRQRHANVPLSILQNLRLHQSQNGRACNLSVLESYSELLHPTSEHSGTVLATVAENSVRCMSVLCWSVVHFLLGKLRSLSAPADSFLDLLTTFRSYASIQTV